MSSSVLNRDTETSVLRHPGGRSSFNRIFHIHRQLSNGVRTNANALARELETSSRTIKRDIEVMRDFHGAPIEWEPSTNSYFYSRPCPMLPLLRLSADEALALVLAENTFASWKGSPLGQALCGILGKIADIAGDSVSIPAEEISRLLTQQEDSGDSEVEQHLFATLLECIRQRSEVRLSYRKPGAKRSENRIVHPLHLAFLDHRWALVAFDPSKKGLRNFLLARMEKLEPSGDHFVKPAGFDARTYLAGSFGLFTGEKAQSVRILFDAFAAPYIRERRWHPSQAIEERSDGSIEVRLELNHLIDVQRWILSWGSHAEAIAPEELREAVAREITLVASRYKTPHYIP